MTTQKDSLQIDDSNRPSDKNEILIPTLRIKSKHSKKGFCRSCWTMPGRFMFSLVILSLIFTPALILITQWPKAANWIHNIVLKKVQLYPQSAGYKTWIDSPVTTTRAYRLFNVTNYMTVMSSPNSPIEIQETDPFMYKLLIRKNDIEWFNDNTEVTYTVERFFERLGIFDKTLLEGEGAFVNIPRVLFRTRFDRKPDQNFFAGSGLNVFNYTHAVDLIEGFNSATFSLIRSNMMGPNTEKYGYIYRYNTSRGYNYTIRTGFNDSVDKGRMLDYKTEYSSFTTNSDKYDFAVYDSLTFPPLSNPTRLAAINVFQADFCRPVQLRYSQTIPMFGFDAVHEYVLRLVDYETCSHMNETCEESVYLDISKCFSDVLNDVFYLSKPHTYTTHNSSVINWNVNFSPDKDKHESTIYFEPITGTPIKAQLRIQLNTNTYIDRIKVDRYGNAKETDSRGVKRVIPMFWIDQTITLNKSTLRRLRVANRILRIGRRIYETIKVGHMIVAFLLCLAVIAFFEAMHYVRQHRSIAKLTTKSRNPETSGRRTSVSDNLLA